MQGMEESLDSRKERQYLVQSLVAPKGKLSQRKKGDWPEMIQLQGPDCTWSPAYWPGQGFTIHAAFLEEKASNVGVLERNVSLRGSPKSEHQDESQALWSHAAGVTERNLGGGPRPGFLSLLCH